MVRNRTRALGVMGLLIASGCGQPDAGAEDPVDTAPAAAHAADHHLHIRSVAGAALLDELEALFGEGEETPAGSNDPVGSDEVIEALDYAGVERGIVLSIAYMFAAPDVEVEDEYARVRAENDYVAEQVSRYPDRLIGACSISPLAEYALEEIERCAADPRLTALKLHLANSDVSLRDPVPVGRLADVFRLAARLDLPVIAHIRNRAPDYGAEDARVFIDEVLSQAPNLPVQIAHMAGWGGYDEGTDAALGEFVTAIGDGRLDPDLYTFDVAAVVFQPAAAGADTALMRQVTEANAQLAERIRQLGFDRVVYATDWPSWPPTPDRAARIERNITLINEALPLSDEERARIFANAGPVLRRGS